MSNQHTKVHFNIEPWHTNETYKIQCYSIDGIWKSKTLYVKEFKLNKASKYFREFHILIQNYTLTTEEKLKRFQLDGDLIRDYITKSEYDAQLHGLLFNSMKRYIEVDISNYINIIKIENAEEYI